MRAGAVTVAIPVRNGQAYLAEVLRSVRAQEIDREVELLVVDSGSTDRSVDIACSAGARVVEIPPSHFSHGGTRNMIMEIAKGNHVAFLTQDASPADERWLLKLLEGFEFADDVALVFGPYIPRPGASHMVQREFRDFFGGFSQDGRPVVQRLSPDPSVRERYRRRPSPLVFFTDANGCVARWAWELVPYRNVPYAEDQLLASEMIEAGFAKVFRPDAGVYHSHEYRPLELFRRCFDEWRALREVYGHVESAQPRRVVKRILEESRADVAFLRERGSSFSSCARGGSHSLFHHTIRMAGAIVGSRADRIPTRLRSALSLEGRADFCPSEGLSGSIEPSHAR
jgi:glycosyltransferase involved in cell wall biosynthesis